MNRDRIQESQKLIIDIFKSYREELLLHYGKTRFDLKMNASEVTEYDLAIEKRLRQEIKEKFPEFGFKGEETGYDTDKTAYWIVDPIDGTMPFIRGLPGCTNMAAFISDGEIISAVIYDFVGDRLYTSYIGEGAWCDGKKLEVRKYAQNLVFSIWGESSFSGANKVLKPSRVKLKTIMGAGDSGINVANGKFDGFLNVSVDRQNEHDVAPMLGLMREAGAELVVIEEPLIENGKYGRFFAGNRVAAKVIKDYLEEFKNI